MSEFSLIKQYFTRETKHSDLGVGDDCALVQVANNIQLAISTDMLVAGTHFFADAAPYDIGWKSLAVNISDMAAMGANPKWATLAIALPNADEAWLSEFSRGFFACADAFNVDLIGGDTTRGALNIGVTIMGEVPIGKALRRDGAKIGDDIWVSGNLGSAALGLAHLQAKIVLNDGLDACLNALHHPTPRVSLGLALRNLAHSCIDISDGLLADLGHILAQSNLGATIELEQIPCLEHTKNQLENPIYQTAVLVGGDDYELCFTAPKNKRADIRKIAQDLRLNLTPIGQIHAKNTFNNNNLTVFPFEFQNLTVLKCQKPLLIDSKGFDHFAT